MSLAGSLRLMESFVKPFMVSPARFSDVDVDFESDEYYVRYRCLECSNIHSVRLSFRTRIRGRTIFLKLNLGGVRVARRFTGKRISRLVSEEVLISNGLVGTKTATKILSHFHEFYNADHCFIFSLDKKADLPPFQRLLEDCAKVALQDHGVKFDSESVHLVKV